MKRRNVVLLPSGWGTTAVQRGRLMCHIIEFKFRFVSYSFPISSLYDTAKQPLRKLNDQKVSFTPQTSPPPRSLSQRPRCTAVVPVGITSVLSNRISYYVCTFDDVSYVVCRVVVS